MSLHLIRDCATFSFRVSLKKDFASTERKVLGIEHGDTEFLCPWLDFACSEFCFEHQSQNLLKHS